MNSNRETAAQPPKRIWTQLYSPAKGYGLTTIAAYDRDPREVHDNGKPVYEYVLDAKDASPDVRELAERIAFVIAERRFEFNWSSTLFPSQLLADIIIEELTRGKA